MPCITTLECWMQRTLQMGTNYVVTKSRIQKSKTTAPTTPLTDPPSKDRLGLEFEVAAPDPGSIPSPSALRNSKTSDSFAIGKPPIQHCLTRCNVSPPIRANLTAKLVRLPTHSRCRFIRITGANAHWRLAMPTPQLVPNRAISLPVLHPLIH